MDNTQEQAQLFVGAIIYCIEGDHITGIYKIVRTTPTQAVSDKGDAKFKLGSFNGEAKKVGADSWDRGLYYLETPELKQKLWRQNAISKCSKADFSKLSNEQLQAILNIINA
jgi:hypothetical protein